jgi:PAS domain S-box-containing protein
MSNPDESFGPSETELLRIEVATLTDLIGVHEEAAGRQFELIRAQRKDLEARAESLSRMNQELSESAAFLREVYRTIPGVLLVSESRGIIESANEAAASLLEQTEPELIGASIESVFKKSETFDPARLEELAAHRGVFQVETVIRSKSGTRIPALLYAALTSEGSGRRLVCIALDIRDRKRLEMELHHAQKLESVGRLAAGVAHEINTPVQFVGDSIHFLRTASEDVFGVMGKLETVARSVLDGSPSAEAARDAIASLEAADLPFLMENVPRAFERSRDGLARVAEIVRSMKEFAHPDVKEMTVVDLNHAVETTLTIARSEYRYVAEVKMLLGQLPPVTCHAGDVNQAILNIVVNAAHAIADVVRGTGEKGLITVRTHCDGDTVELAVSDTGTGIPEDIREHVFDPFFTTKEIGKGTGQGLSIARAVVVDRHRGSLSFQTEPGMGTTFYMRLPVNGPGAAQSDESRAAA